MARGALSLGKIQLAGIEVTVWLRSGERFLSCEDCDLLKPLLDTMTAAQMITLWSLTPCEHVAP